jgi:RNA polymerase sigma-70 factor, ECF subfamily
MQVRAEPMTSKPSERQAGAVVRLRRAGSDEELVTSLHEGVPSAGRDLVYAYGGHVRKVLMRVLGPDRELDDLAQDVFVMALESLHRLENPRALRGWLAQIAVFRARRCLRGRKQWQILRFFAPEQMPPGRATTPDFEASEALRAAYRLLSSLQVDERIAFALRFIEGMDLAEVAAACRVSLATTKRRLARAEVRFGELARDEPALAEWMGVPR